MVEIIPKPQRKLPPFDILFFGGAVLFFLISLFFYFYFHSLQEKLENKIKAIESQIEISRSGEIRELEKKVFSYQEKISQVADILAKRNYPSKFFPLLEQNTLKTVSFQKLQLDFGNLKGTASGKTENFYTLSQQMEICKKAFANCNLKNVSIGQEGKLNFEVEFSIPKSQ